MKQFAGFDCPLDEPQNFQLRHIDEDADSDDSDNLEFDRYASTNDRYGDAAPV